MNTLLVPLIALWIGTVDGQGYFFVTAPNVLRFNQDEPILMNIFNTRNVRIDVWLQTDDSNTPFSSTSATVREENEPVSRTIKVTERDLFPNGTVTDKKPKYVTLYARTDTFGTYSRRILLNYETGYIIIQMSKPVYHPNDEVKVRVLALTETLQAATTWNITLDLIGPNEAKSYGRVVRTDHEIFFEDAFKLPPNAELGLWTIKAYYGGQYVTEARATFRVQKYVLPTFGVNVKVNKKIILKDTESVTITVNAEYVYKKPVNGHTVLNVSCLGEDGTIQTLSEQISRPLVEGTTDIVIQVEDLTKLFGYFPTGYRLFVVARVIERATGKEEKGGNKDTLFSEQLYKISFEKSKKTYRPGFSYHLKVVVKYANGESEAGLDTRAEIDENQIEDIKKTDVDGYVLFVHNVASDVKGPLTFKISVGDVNPYHEEFTVDSYQGENLLQVDQKMKGNDMIIEATTTIKGDQFSGIMTLITSRGKYIDCMYFQPGTSQEQLVDDVTISHISSEARVVGFYVELRTGKLTADSSKFSVTPRCRGDGLTLEMDQTSFAPDSRQILTITGTPSMQVGLNIIDEALLLVENSNILKKSKMFDTLKAHDIGCGQGGGETAEQVLKDAGLTVVTNADVDAGELNRASMRCQHHSRRKRSLDCDSSAKYHCCKLGEAYAKELKEQTKGAYKTEDLPDPYTKCLAKTLELEKLKYDGWNKYSLPCLQHHLLKCIEVLLESQEDMLGKSIFDDGDDYISALTAINVDVLDIHFRKDFSDSFSFDNYRLEEGNFEREILFPSSITSWMIQAIGVSDAAGPCIADPLSVRTYKDFFVQLDVPYRAFRLEYFEIAATVFYYGNPNDNAKVSLFLEGDKFLCTGVKSGETKKIASFTMKKNDAYSVRIPILALKAAQFPIQVIAVGQVAGHGTYDAIQKTIIIENEGIEESEKVTVCLDPRNNNGHGNCTNSDRVISSRLIDDYQQVEVDLTLPTHAIKETGSANGFLSSNVMDDAVRSIIKGMDSLFLMPTGCAQQTASKLAPLVYVYHYWKQTKQLTKEREQDGNKWIREGIIHQLTYKKNDDAYGVFISSPSSTRLTAMVAKVLCQANKVVDNAVKRDEEIVPILRWLQKHVDDKAAFYDENPYTNMNVDGRSTSEHSLTAFVLITLLECDTRLADFDDTIRAAKSYLLDLKESVYRNDPYTLAISTYALSMAGKPYSNKVWNMFNLLKQIGQRDLNKRHLYWGGGSSSGVLTTSYALLACIKFSDWSAAADIVRWLMVQRGSTGAFYSTDDTVVGLQALAEYNANIYSENVNLDVELNSVGFRTSHILTTENSVLQKTIEEIPAKVSKTSLMVVTKGSGTGRLVIDLRYNRLQTADEMCSFNIDKFYVEEIKDPAALIAYNTSRKCDVCGRCEGDDGTNDYITTVGPTPGGNDPPENRNKQFCVEFELSSLQNRQHGMSIVDVGLETGVTVKEDDLKKLQESGIIDEYTMPGSGKGFFILYIKEITNSPTKFIFRLEDDFSGDDQSRQPAAIKVYDYYQPDFRCARFYGTGGKDGSPTEYSCANIDSHKQETCKCLKERCPQNAKKELKKIYANWKLNQEDEEARKPVDVLQDHTCDNTKADFAVLITITSVDPDFTNLIHNAEATVTKCIHRGRQSYEQDDKIKLYWKMNCEWLTEEIEENETYYLITKDGEFSEGKAGENEYNRYELMDTTVIIKQSKRKDLYWHIMNKYEEVMATGCKEGD